MPESYHIPVLLHESIAGLITDTNGVYADVTFGGGGHSRAILNALSTKGRLLAFDQDSDTLANLPNDPRFLFAQSNFRYLSNFVRHYQLPPLNGILADLGVSSHHFDDAARGFSFRFDGPLDMRMNQQANKTAADIVNEYDATHLADIFYLYGEIKASRALAANIIKARQNQPIRTIADLTNLVRPFCGKDEKKDLARIFQALRIEVNDELGALRQLLSAAVNNLAKGGRLVVITYHSLEDRLVKNFIKSGNFEGRIEQDFYGNICAPLSAYNKMITPSPEELTTNPRSRSAKLRIAEKK